MVIPMRRRWLVLQLTTNGVIVAAIVSIVPVALGQPADVLFLAPIAFVAQAAVASRTIRRRHLVLGDDGLTAVRNGYRLRARWDDIVGFEQRRFAWVVPVTVACVAGATIEPLGATPLTDRALSRIRRAGADSAIQLTVYIADLAAGPLADALRTNRPDLQVPRNVTR